MAPSDTLLRALCEVLDVEEAFFYRDVVDEYAVHECSFRHLQSVSRKLLEEVLARGTLYQELLNRLASFVELPPTNIPSIPVTSDEDVERAAIEARNAWGIGVAAPVVNAIRVAEHAGIVVTRLAGVSEKVDAFSRFGEPPVIVLTSTKGSTSRDRFNVAHELGHLVMHRGQITGDVHSEREADRFAAAMLLPRDAFSSEFRALPVIDWPHLFELKRRWFVSGAAILHRGDELGLLSAVAIRRLYKQYMWRRWNKGEPFEPREETPELIPLALQVVDDDYSEDLWSLASAVGLGQQLTETVTGFIRTPTPPANVARLDKYRR